VKPQLNHTIVHALDREESATFFAEVLGFDGPVDAGYFLEIETGNGVNLDFAPAESVEPQHYAFLVTEREFDEIFGRITERGLTHWADPSRQQVDQINRHDGGRGVYFCDPSGHFLEILTRPYGSGPRN
jgi:catechol 2,3-dioxygenase-like lactoylglutathione lyase family enzyme